MREADQAECLALGVTPEQAVRDGMACSLWTVAGVADGEVGCIFGLAAKGTLLNPVGVPWMLGTDLVATHRRVLARRAPAYIRRMLRTHPRLENVVHAKNTLAVRWLRRVGFTLRPPVPASGGELFHPFELRA